MRRVLLLAMAIAMLATACGSDSGDAGSGDPGNGPTPLVVDYSPTVSDVGALLYLLANPDVDVRAVTLAATGEAGCELGVAVTLGLLALMDQDDIPVSCDPDAPAGARSWPAAFTEGADQLLAGLPGTGELEGDDRLPAQLIADTVGSSDTPVTLYAVAPLTNVARFLDEHPESAASIGQIVIMGGAVDVAGNVADSEAEWNFWIDPAAAAAVLGADVPITLVPLDATNDVPVPGLWLDALAAGPQTDAVGYLTSVLRTFPSATLSSFFMWDELAASVAAAQPFVTTEELLLSVDADGVVDVDPQGQPIEVAVGVAVPEEFYGHFHSVLAAEPVPVRAVATLDDAAAMQRPGPEAGPEEVLAYWVASALGGDVEAAASVVAPEPRWDSLGGSPESFVAGSAPYEAFDVALACSAIESRAVCDVVFNDLWLAENPAIDRGGLRVEAELDGRTIVAFAELQFPAEITTAFAEHLEWLAATQPDAYEQACGSDPASAACSSLLVASGAEWQASG